MTMTPLFSSSFFSFFFLLLLAALPLLTRGASRTSPPKGCLVVSKSPPAGQYGTVSAAVAAASTGDCIFVHAGTYSEQVFVRSAAQLTLYGATNDTGSWAANAVTLTGSRSQADGLSNDETATLRVGAAAQGFRLYNVNVNNGHGKGSQAVALSAQADSGFYGSAFTGFQDTLLANAGRQVYARCLVQGATDFVFGRQGQAWFEACDVRVVAANQGFITASGRESASDSSYYVFNKCNIAAAAGNSVPAGAYYLGRPWAAYARVVWQKTEMSSVINAAGWRVWNSGDERTGNVLFGEYANTGPGAAGTRASFAKKLDGPVSMATVLGSGYAAGAYYDASYL